MRRFLVVFVLAGVFAGSASAKGGFTKQDVTIPASDGVPLAGTLYVPTAVPRQPGGWPAVMLFHGLGGTRASMDEIATNFASLDFAVLAYDARGHGDSGGLVTLDGPREIQDVREAFAWLAARPEVSDTQIGAMGFSYGGGAVLRATVEGVPFKAIVPAITWTNLYDALFPQNLAKSGAVAGFYRSVQRWDPSVLALIPSALQSANLDTIRAFTDERSSLAGLSQVTTPTFFIQGRRDFAFDIRQAYEGYRRVRGPKRLYLGELGHAPAANPANERAHYIGEARLWFARYLYGGLNGIDKRPPIEISWAPWSGGYSHFARLPKTRTLSYRLAGRRTLAASGSVTRTVKLPRRRLETFGSPQVSATVSSTTGWRHLVAVLTARTPSGKEIVVSEGGIQPAAIGAKPRRVAIRMIDQATPIPRGSRLALTLASSSTAQNPGNLLYLDVGMPQSAQVTIRDVRIRLPVLRRPLRQ